jgi:dihydropteroate synthase
MKKELNWGTHTHVMGIINLTPDSFSGDGLGKDDLVIDRALPQAKQMLSDGAEMLDLGAESSRPGAGLVNASEEIERLFPVLKAIREAEKEIILSVDTYKSIVAEEALKAGADWVNDIWGLRFDPKMAEVVQRYGAGVILMHNGRELGETSNERKRAKPRDTVQWVMEGLKESIEIAKQAGIKDDDIILDAGIGFGKSVEENLELVNRLGEFKSMGYPLLIGPSRKSFIGATLDLPVEQRLEGTAAAVAISIARGADIIRVHDVREMSRVAKMCDAILAKR